MHERPCKPLRSEVGEGKIHGIKICQGAPKINHLLFTEDSIIFYKANVPTCKKILKVLKIYEKASWQKINTSKTMMIFSRNVHSNQRNQLVDLRNTPGSQQYDRYLRLPLYLVEQRRRLSWRSKYECGRNFRRGKRLCYLKGARKYYLRQWPSLSPLIL